MSIFKVALSLLLLCTFVLIACQSTSIQSHPANTVRAPSVSDTSPTDFAGLHQVVAYVSDIYSGAVPEGDEGFESLKAMGVKTIISVDGAKSQLSKAQKQGLRYVHLPFGYDGVPRERQLQIARAVRDLEHPIYIHCHHGKHRSAAGTASAAVTLGLITVEQAIARMKVSGTSPNYKGLYETVQSTQPALISEMDQVSNEFPEVWQTENMVDAMVAIDVAHDHLKAIQKAHWKVPAEHPDLIPVSEAARLADLLRNLKDDEHVHKESEQLRDWFLKASAQVTELETQLLVDQSQAQKLDGLFKQVTQSCKDCHAVYRN